MFIQPAKAASHAADTAATASILAVLAGYLPIGVTILAAIWYLLQIWESKTVCDWRMKRAEIRAMRRMAKELNHE